MLYVSFVYLVLILVTFCFSYVLPGIIANHTLELNDGDSVTLNCSVISNPAAYVTWTKGENTVVSSVTGQGLELYLMDITLDDINTYSCSAWNPHGDTSDFVDIILQCKCWVIE